MNEQERAEDFSNRLDQEISGVSPEPTFTGEENGFITLSKELVYHSPFAPDPTRRASARARLRDRFVRHHEWYDRPLAGEGWVRTFGLAVIVTVLLVGMVWMIKDLSGQPGTPVDVQPSAKPNEGTALPTPTEETNGHNEEVIPAANVLVAGSCTLSGDVLDDPAFWWGPEEKRPEALAGYGRSEVGDFTFTLALACDDRFRQDPAMYQSFSEIEGLGIVTYWQHPGWESEGEVVEYSGFEPYVRITGSSGAGSTPGSVSGRTVTGVQFPPGVIPDFTQKDVRLRYLLKIQGPDGSLAGAAISFTLQREPDGYRPVDVTIQALSEDELLPLEPDPDAMPPFPVKSPYAEYPELQEIAVLLETWEQSLTSEPGWVHLLDRVYDTSGNELYGGLTDFNSEQWLKLDENGYIVASVFTEWADDGRILQQAYTKDGRGTNLTFGSDEFAQDAKLTRLSLGGDIISRTLAALRSERPVDLVEESYEGKPGLVVSYTEAFSQPITMDSREVVEILIRDGIDRTTGAWLFTERLVTTIDGERVLTYRRVFQVAERASEPPEEVMAVFGMDFGGYQPADPVGTPAPAGFDPSKLPLTSVTVHGDDFNHPSFFFGDLNAGGYFLGRVDFGSSPGGWCRRSADGSKLAFKHQMLAGSQMRSSEIRWVDLLDGARVHSPAPDLFVDSQLAWSPVKEEVAFFACRAERTDCGLYLLDTVTDQVRFVSGVGTTLWDPLWSPDGSQVAFVDTTDSDFTLFIIEIINGGVVYEAPFDGEAWKAPDDAPIYLWGMDFPHGWDGGNCFEK